jgi:SAM-dependent methyltransferase
MTISSEATHFLTVDELGQVFDSTNAEAPVLFPPQTSERKLMQFYSGLELNEKASLKTHIDAIEHYVESFDAPIVIQNFNLKGRDCMAKGLLSAQTTTGFTETVDLNRILVDEWDRFYGLSRKNIPFVLCDEAQNELFELCDEYDDDSLTYKGVVYQTNKLYPDQAPVEKNNYWNQVYQDEAKPRWDLNQASPVLIDMLPRLKLPKARILVLGCGFGHDAAFFAQNGHIVTAVDFSPLAIAGAKERYGHLTNIRWQTADALNLPPEFHESFDLVFEHTCFCAINPIHRQKLVQAWLRCLATNGTLFAVFFSMFKFQGPPFGATEWEVRKRLGARFQFLFWNRWRKSIPGRMGRELFVYARKKSL